MLNKKKAAAIQGLNISVEQMSEAELKKYEFALNAFVESFPLQETGLKSALGGRDYGSLANWLIGVADMLKEINADGLMAECKDFAAYLSKTEYLSNTVIEARLTAVLSDITALSIDIQMVIYDNRPEAAAGAAAARSGGQKLILAVDDVALFLQTLKTNLAGSPYKLVCVTSGADALRFIATKEPDLFILDLEMPGMDGYELARRIKEQKIFAPIIFLTGNANREYVVKALQVGAADFLVKPIDKKQVLSRIASLIGE
ncbi:MAG: response regulator [Chitinispirillia bacterium]|nr:response regulator [Chitinispirillia bacterium]